MATIIAVFKGRGMNQPDDTSNRKRLIRDTLVEFVATAVFINFGTLAAVGTGLKLAVVGDPADVARVLPIAMAFGISIMALAFAIGHLSGGHMNPGVSLMMALKRQMSIKKMTCYWLAQFIASLLGASITWGCTSNLDEQYTGSPPLLLGSTTLDTKAVSTGNGFLLELMGSFFFYFVIAQTALDTRGIGGSMFPPIPIGFVLVVVHICLIPFTGCGVNPARTFGPAMVTCMAGRCDEVVASWWWIYWVGPFTASWLVAEVTDLMEWNVDDDEEEAAEKEDPAVEEPAKSLGMEPEISVDEGVEDA